MMMLDPNQQQKKPLPGQPGGGLAPLGEQQAQMPMTDPGQQIDGPPPVPKVGGGLGPAPGIALGDPNRPPPQIGKAPAPAAPTMAAGWEDVGYGNLVRNSTTGQMVDRNHPVYTSALAASPAPTTPAAPGAPAAPAAQPPATIADSFKTALVNKLNPTGPIDATNSAIAPGIEANKLAEQRGVERQRNLLAEQAAKDGTDMSGGFRTNLLGLEQDSAARQGQYAGNAVQHLSDQRDADLMAALGIGGASVGQDKSLSMQDKLAQLDASIRNRGIDSQAATAASDIALRQRLGEGGLNNQLLGLLLGHDEFGQQLGQNAAQFGQQMDANTILGLLGGF